MKCDNPGDDYYWQNSLMNDKYMYMYTKTVFCDVGCTRLRKKSHINRENIPKYQSHILYALRKNKYSYIGL